MFTKEGLKKTEANNKKWQELFQEYISKTGERLPRFSTVSDHPVRSLYTPLDLRDHDYSRDIGFPGQYPFTRGVQPSMYRGRLWTMRMFAGLGSARDTNRRFHLLVEEGETGLSTAFDMPTLMGYDTNAPKARGECGRCGVAIDTLKDMEVLFEGLPIDRITTSMTINPPAAVLGTVEPFWVPSSSGLGYRPLTPETRVRFPLGLPRNIKDLSILGKSFFCFWVRIDAFGCTKLQTDHMTRDKSRPIFQ